MKRYRNSLLCLCSTLALAAGIAACSDNNPVDSSTSVVITEPTVPNDFDKWLEKHIMKPYNIELRYKLKDNETSMLYNLAPANYEKSIQMAHLVKYLCLETYDEATGSTEFVRSLFPKLVDFIGSPAYNTNGTIVLGTAEGGRKMTLYKVNDLNPKDVEALNHYYFKTVHHEFGHIQNQTKPYPKEFQQVTPTTYVSDSWNAKWDNPKDIRSTVRKEVRANYPKLLELDKYTDEQSLLKAKKEPSTQDQARLKELATLIATFKKGEEYIRQAKEYDRLVVYSEKIDVATLNSLRAGFISPYGSSQHGEDFVEIQAIFMTDAPELWEAKMLFAGETGRNLIQQKYNIVESYLKNDWGISLKSLRDIVQKRQKALGGQNLTDLSIN